MDLETAAKEHRLKIMRLEDGEVVIPLRGWKKKARHGSDNPHCGIWGANLWYVLIEAKQPNRPAGAALAFDTTLTPKTTDNACMVFGSASQILSLVTKGPKPFRAMKRRVLSASHAEKLAQANKQHRFMPSLEKAG